MPYNYSTIDGPKHWCLESGRSIVSTMSMDMLSYEQELQLSDLIVARRAVTDLLALEGRTDNPSEDERKTIEAGNLAARKLVESYLPLIRSISRSIYDRNYGSQSSAGWDMMDLVNEGVLAALRTTNSFNARGTGKYPGVRFGNYSGMNISKAMNRVVAKMSTPYRADISAIQATWTWRRAEEEYFKTHGRNPTDDELEDITGLSSTFVLPDIPARSAFDDVDDSEYATIPNPITARISDSRAYERCSRDLREILENIIPAPYMPYAEILFALNSDMPYDAEDAAKILGKSRRKVLGCNEYLMNFISHPRYRVMIHKAIKDQEALREALRNGEQAKEPSERRSVRPMQHSGRSPVEMDAAQ